jgi:hypothetical protein
MSNTQATLSSIQLTEGQMVFKGLGAGLFTLSIGMASMHYAGNRGGDSTAPSETMEVCVLSKDGEYLLEGTVAPYVPVDLLLGILMDLKGGHLKEVQLKLADY